MKDILFLAWQYLRFHRLRTAALVAAIALVLYVPSALKVIVSQSETRLRSRADSTPLIVGAKGSPLELALSSLYFDTDPSEPIPVATADLVGSRQGIDAVPIYCRFEAEGYRVVGTTDEYFEHRELGLDAGSPLEELGECVLGSTVARELELSVGDTILTSSESAFDIAGVYPTMLKVVGVLHPADSPDDRALFVSLKTAWIIEGLGHGHDEFATPIHNDETLATDRKAAAAHAALKTYRQVTEENINSFHFHGDRGQFPITAVLAFPSDQKSGTMLEGSITNSRESLQIIVSTTIINELLQTVLTVESLVLFGAVVIGCSTAITVALVYWLALRLRQNELETMRRIGCSTGTIPLLILTELSAILLLSATLAGGLTGVTYLLSDDAYRLLLQF